MEQAHRDTGNDVDSDYKSDYLTKRRGVSNEKCNWKHADFYKNIQGNYFKRMDASSIWSRLVASTRVVAEMERFKRGDNDALRVLCKRENVQHALHVNPAYVCENYRVNAT